jgi:protein gp37
VIAPSAPTAAAALGLDLNGIMWCDATLNPGLAGCAYASPACGTANRSSACYAEVTAAGIVRKGRSDKAPPGMRATAEFYAKGLTPDGRWTGRVHVDPTRIAPAFAKLPKRPGRIRRVFVTSMSDLFHEDVPFDFLDAVFAEMEARGWFVFQATTKRAKRARAYAEDRRRRGLSWPGNVWLIVTVERQREADERIPDALAVGAPVVGLSVEPMLGAVDLSRWIERIDHCDSCRAENPPQEADLCPECGQDGTLIATWGEAQAERYRTGERYDEESEAGRADLAGTAPRIDWVILGSESDGNRPGARETREEWVLDLVDQCDAAGTAVFVKQLAIDGRLCSLPLVRGRVRAEFPEVPRG